MKRCSRRHRDGLENLNVTVLLNRKRSQMSHTAFHKLFTALRAESVTLVINNGWFAVVQINVVSYTLPHRWKLQRVLRLRVSINEILTDWSNYTTNYMNKRESTSCHYDFCPSLKSLFSSCQKTETVLDCLTCVCWQTVYLMSKNT